MADYYAYTRISHGTSEGVATFEPGHKFKAKELPGDVMKAMVESGAIVNFDRNVVEAHLAAQRSGDPVAAVGVGEIPSEKTSADSDKAGTDKGTEVN